VAGKPVALSFTEFEILLALVRRKGLVVTRDTLLERVWSGDFVEARSVDPHISRLRRKLGAEGERVETVPGVGYRLRG
jgi:DNA-binding winged helix-turn-helix (wHTH) protein